MRLGRAVAVLVGLLPAASGVCGLEASVLMHYAYEPGAEVQFEVTAKLLGVEMGGGVPVEVSGSADAEVAMQVLEVDRDGTATIRLSFGKLRSDLMGSVEERDDLEPINLKVDKYGRAVGPDAPGGMEFDIFRSGGIPLQIVVMLGATVELPAKAVAVGESWSTERSSKVRGLGEVTLAATSRLESLDTEKAVMVTTIEGDLPDFTTENPIQDGEIQVRDGYVAIGPIKRTIRLATGLVETADAELTFICTANIGAAADLPLIVNSSFELKPRGVSQQTRHDDSDEASVRQLQAPPQPVAEVAANGLPFVERVAWTVLACVDALMGKVAAWWETP